MSLRVLTSAVNDALSKRGLRPLPRGDFPTGCFFLAYATDNKFEDLVESARQATNERGTDRVIRWLLGTQPGPAAFETVLINDLRERSDPTRTLPEEQDLQEQLSGYDRLVRQLGHKVILVAHSQGNFFANEAFRRLVSSTDPINPQLFATVPVASPAVQSLGGITHITLYGDIILWVATQPANTDVSGTACIPNPLSPNLPPVPGFNGTVCHSFEQSYLAPGSDARGIILNSIMLEIPPILARDNTYTMFQGSTLTVPAPGVLVNDDIPPGLVGSVEFLPPFPPGSLINHSSSGGFTFTPNSGFTGTIAFTYIFHTGVGDSNVATVTVEVGPAPVLTSMSDDFNDNSLNLSLWQPYADPNASAGSVAETNQRLEVTLNPGTANVGVRTLCSLAGDFDVQVDYILLNWSSNNHQGLSLGVVDLGQGTFGQNRVERFNEGGTGYYHMMFPNTIGPFVSTSDMSGTLKLVRKSSTLEGYYRSGSTFVLIGSTVVPTTQTRFHLNGGLFVSDALAASFAFDNFKVNAGLVSCPP